jgi:hypothetical protein
MKYLDVPSFGALSSALSVINGDQQILCQIEAYSCKNAGADKKNLKQYSQEVPLNDMQFLSPPQTAASPPSPQFSMISRKTLYFLLATLNAHFSDYDFTHTSAQCFTREPRVEFVASAVNHSLHEVVGARYNEMKERLWAELDATIELSNSEIYSYIPQANSDPFYEDGVLWSFNYFFFNLKLRRIVFFSCRSMSVSVLQSFPHGGIEYGYSPPEDTDRSVFGEMEDFALASG